MRVTIIAAVAENRAIGEEGGIPWRLPGDLAFFKRTTMGHTLIMGRRTFESAGALPGRRTVVLTRDPSWRPPERSGVETAPGLEEALHRAEETGEEEVFVCGGAGVYATALERADRMVLTQVEGEFEADTFFPVFDRERWCLVSRDDRPADEQNPHRHSFQIWERRRPGR